MTLSMVRDLLVGPGEGDWDEVGFKSEGDPTDGDTLRIWRRLDALSWFKLGGVIGGWVSRETGRLGGGGWWVAASAQTEEIGAEGVDGRTGGCGAGIGTIGGVSEETQAAGLGLRSILIEEGGGVSAEMRDL